MAVPHVQTKTEIEAALALAGLSPRRRFGQNFLIDGNLMRRMVDAATLTSDDVVLEVGGGTGGLTDLLVERVRRVICVEVDHGLQSVLRERFAGRSNFTLIAGDALASKHRLHADLESVLNHAASESPSGVKLVANLPYQVATPLVMNLLVGYPCVSQLCFTVQAEVGERITSPPGRRTYGPLSVLAQVLAECHTIASIPPEAFWPRPAVHSVMLRLQTRSPAPFADRPALAKFASLVRGAFDHRRKTLRQALAFVLPEDAAARLSEHIDPIRRPETLSVAEWVSLVAAL